MINPGLFYLDWLMGHRKDFEWLVLEKLGKDEAKTVDWSGPRLICIAGDCCWTNRIQDRDRSTAAQSTSSRVAAGDPILYRLDILYGANHLVFEWTSSRATMQGDGEV